MKTKMGHVDLLGLTQCGDCSASSSVCYLRLVGLNCVFTFLADPRGLCFHPPGGLLRVGDSDVIACVFCSDDGNKSDGVFMLTDIESREALLWADFESRPVQVKPPKGLSSYPNFGSTEIKCNWTDGKGAYVERSLIVRILRKCVAMIGMMIV